MKSMNRIKRKWIAQILAVLMVLSTLITAATPQHVLAEDSPVTIETETSTTVTGSTITDNVSDGSEITISTPIELYTTAVTGAAIKFKVNDGMEKEYDKPFTLGEYGVSSEAKSATVTAYTYSTEDESIKSSDTLLSYTIEKESTGVAQDLFISEYIEGSSNNKAIEIYNGTGADVDLSGYSVYLYANGATTPNNKAFLSGILANGKTYVLYNSDQKVNDAIKSVGNLPSSVANFNGDDALELRKGEVIIDVIGIVGNDPGKSWTDGVVDTVDKTLVRKSTVPKGNTTFTFNEWDVYKQDTFTYLGSHTMDGGNVGNDVAPVIGNPASGSIISNSQEITLSCNTTGAAISYKFNESDPWIPYSDKLTINTTENQITIYIKAEAAGKNTYEGILTYSLQSESGIISIKQARAFFDPKVTDKIVSVTGVVTFIDKNNVYIQDSTAGIDAYFSGGVVKPSSVEIGKELTVTGVLADYNGLMEITKISEAKVGETRPLPEPKLVNLNTIDNAGYEELESQRVRFEGVTLGAINTEKDTPITSTEGKTLNIFRMPALDGIVAGDLINVIGVIGQFNNYQLRVVDKSHVTKASDKFGPAINTDNLEDVQKGKDYRVVVVVTDSTGVKEVKLSYIADGVTIKNVTLTDKGAGQYEYIIPAAELIGTKVVLNFTATDTMEPANISTASIEKSITDLPRILSVLPADGSSTGEGVYRPSIIANFDNAGEEPVIAMKLDSSAITPVVTKAGEVYTTTYNPPTDLSIGEHKVELTITRKDLKTLTYTWSFYVGKLEYNVYFGQIHAHTNLSDGAGEVEDAFKYAAKANNVDFLAITDHSNWLEETAGTNNIADASKSPKWIRGKKAAADITAAESDFVGIYAYEMTWSGGSIGHMNTFNTPGFENRNNAPFKTTTALKTYFEALKTQPQSISMFNHPGKTFGDFGDFSYWDPAIDNMVTLIEVGNGEGPVRQSGYFPSYEFYTRALDKGWHLAPANNQDNHKGKWGDANTARTVILAPELTEEAIYDAMRDKRVYATEDHNLSIIYTLNNSIMGSIVKDTEAPVNISVDINDPDKEAIGKVEVIVNGGMVVGTKNVTTHDETVDFTIPSNYSYYFIRITQTDKDIAVTAPVWVGNVEKCGISKSEVNKELCMKGEEIQITTSYYNNETLPLVIDKLEYSINGKVIQTVTGLEAVPSLNQGKSTIKYTSPVAGSVNIDVKLYASLDGVEKVFTDVVKINFQDPSIVTKVIIDGTHFNDYVYGYYSGNMANLTKLAAKEMMQVEVVTDKITPQMLEDAGMLIITVPARWNGYLNYENKPTVVSPFSNDFIAMVKEYADNGGNVVICGISDREDRSSSEGTQASTQINKLLAGIGSTTRINSDEGTDYTTYTGKDYYRLHFDTFNMDSEFLNGVVEGQKYSMYKGCSVILDSTAVASGKVQWLVKGHPTTETKSITDYDGNYVPQTKGNVVVLASEKLNGGGFLLVGGSVFMSNFEVQAELDNFGDLQNANYNIILNALKKSEKNITITPIAEARKGKLGEVFTIEGYVTAGTEVGNAFFDTIYIQDETGGMDIFPINEQGIKLGQRVRITGTLAEYENDLELMVIQSSVIDTGIHLMEPELVTTADAANYEKSGGKLIKVQGKVTKVEKVEGVVSYFMVQDASGVPIRAFINGYISSSTGEDHTTKLKVGDTVTAVGLSSMDTEGVRIRVRDRAEIVITGSTGPTDPTNPNLPPSNGTGNDTSVTYNMIENGTKLEVITTKTSYDSKGNVIKEITKVITDLKTNKIVETVEEIKIANSKPGSVLRYVITKGEKKNDVKAETFIEAGISESAREDKKAVITLDILPEQLMEQFKKFGGETKLNVSIQMNTSKLITLLKDKNVNEVIIAIPIPEEIASQEKILFKEIILGKDVMKEAKNQKKTMKVVVTDDKKQEIYSITFDGKALSKSKEELKDLNVSLEILQPKQRNKIFNLINSTIPDNAKHRGLVLECNQKGALPVNAKVRVYVGNQKGFEVGDKVYLYKFNEKAPIGKNRYDFRLEETTTSSAVIRKDGFIEFSINKGGSYVFMPKKARKSILATNIKKTVDAKKEAKTK